MGDVVKLKYKIIAASTEDVDSEVNDLTKPPKQSKGWVSARFCRYPQFLYIRFNYPVQLTQMNVLVHEKKIPSRIDFYSHLPATQGEYANEDYLNLPYVNFGYIKFDSNERSNFTARECKKVFLDIKTYCLKLEIGKNYINRYNSFQQVSVISIEFFGFILQGGKDNFFLKAEETKFNDENRVDISDEELEEICGEKLRMMKEKIAKAIENENYDECKEYKELIDKVRIVAKEIYYKERIKCDAVKREDFDVAISLKGEISKLKEKLDKINIIYLRTQSIKEKELIKKNENEDAAEESIKEEIEEQKAPVQDNNNSNLIHNTSSNSMRVITRQNKSMNNINKISDEDDYDNLVPPTIAKRKNNQSTNDLSIYFEEPDEDNIEKEDLCDIEQIYYLQYPLLTKYIEEEGMKKLFAKQIQFKDEGFEILFQKLTDIFASDENIDDVISELSNAVTIFIEEKHPNTILHTFELIINIIECINLNTKIDINISKLFNERIYKKISDKLSDGSIKIRKQTVDLYIFLLKQEKINYIELINRLIEKDVKNYNNVYILQSSKAIMSKLTILKDVIESLATNSCANANITKETFPKNVVNQYLINNALNSKSEIRKMSRYLIQKYIQIFGVKAIGLKLASIEPRELNKLKEEIPELKEFIDELDMMKNAKLNANDISTASRRSRSKSKSPERKMNSKKSSLSKLSRSKSKSKIKKSDECTYCHILLGNKDLLAEHKETSCPMFTKCPKCEHNIEVKRLNVHLLYECVMKSNYKLCKRCKEAISTEVYDVHIKENRCNPAKNPNSSNRCPLCHKDIPPSDKGFYTHLAVVGCESQSRKVKKY